MAMTNRLEGIKVKSNSLIYFFLSLSFHNLISKSNQTSKHLHVQGPYLLMQRNSKFVLMTAVAVCSENPCHRAIESDSCSSLIFTDLIKINRPGHNILYVCTERIFDRTIHIQQTIFEKNSCKNLQSQSLCFFWHLLRPNQSIIRGTVSL